MRHRGDRETSSAFQQVDFDGSALINFFVGSASHRSGRFESALGRVGSASRRRVVSTVCVGTDSTVRRVDGLRWQFLASRHVASAYIGADDRLTSAAQRFVDTSRTAAGQQRVSS